MQYWWSFVLVNKIYFKHLKLNHSDVNFEHKLYWPLLTEKKGPFHIWESNINKSLSQVSPLSKRESSMKWFFNLCRRQEKCFLVCNIHVGLVTTTSINTVNPSFLLLFASSLNAVKILAEELWSVKKRKKSAFYIYYPPLHSNHLHSLVISNTKFWRDLLIARNIKFLVCVVAGSCL